MDKPRFPRMRCIVPGCTRTSTLFPHEWLCGEHWRLVDRRLKRLRTKALRRARRGRGAGWFQFERFEALIWRRMKRQAIERSAGL